MPAVTPSPNNSKPLQRRVSFRPYVEIAIIPPVDPETRHLQYYSQNELSLIRRDVKRQILALRNSIMEAKKKHKRAASPTSTLDEDSSPMKRMRMAPPVVPVI